VEAHRPLNVLPPKAIRPAFSWRNTKLFHADCRSWLDAQPPNSVQAVVTDPPYGFLEYSVSELVKLRVGRGGIWRIPPAIGGTPRRPLPRFSVLSKSDIANLYNFFNDRGMRMLPVVVPGAYLFVASHPALSHQLARAMMDAAYETRGQIVRLVRTFRGGDRPKGAELEFPDVSASPRSAWEPWLVFRKPLEGTLAQNLRKWQAGGLRRPTRSAPFADVIPSGRTPAVERRIAPHPSLKPQLFLRTLIHASLPLGQGTVLDPFAGSGSTLGAAAALGYPAIGVELDAQYIQLAKKAVPELATLCLPSPHA